LKLIFFTVAADPCQRLDPDVKALRANVVDQHRKKRHHQQKEVTAAGTLAYVFSYSGVLTSRYSL
jgi:hypothetical protein